MFYVRCNWLLLCVNVDLHAFTFFDIQVVYRNCRYPSLSVIRPNCRVMKCLSV